MGQKLNLLEVYNVCVWWRIGRRSISKCSGLFQKLSSEGRGRQPFLVRRVGGTLELSGWGGWREVMNETVLVVERWKLPQRGPGRRPGRQMIFTIFCKHSGCVLLTHQWCCCYLRQEVIVMLLTVVDIVHLPIVSFMGVDHGGTRGTIPPPRIWSRGR